MQKMTNEVTWTTVSWLFGASNLHDDSILENVM